MFTFVAQLLCIDCKMAEKIEHEGVIVGLSINTIYVKIEQQSACSDCHARKSCGVGESKEKIIEIPRYSDDYKEGDRVSVVGKSFMGLKAVVYAFIFPLIIMVLVLVLSIKTGVNDGIAAFISIFVLFLYYILLYFFRDKFKRKFVFSIDRI